MAPGASWPVSWIKTRVTNPIGFFQFSFPSPKSGTFWSSPGSPSPAGGYARLPVV